MNTPSHSHPEEHEELLHAQLAGDLPDDDPQLALNLRECPTCRARHDELSSLTGLLEKVGSEQRQSFAELPDPTSAPGAERVAATLRALAAGQPPARPRPLAAPQRALGPRSATLWRVSLAAASVLAAGWLVKALLPVSEPPRKDVLLGEGSQPILSPADGAIVDEYTGFSWKDESRQARNFELRIWASDSSSTQQPLITQTLYETLWEPTKQQAASLPDAIYWEVTGYNDLGQVCFNEAASATRRAR